MLQGRSDVRLNASGRAMAEAAAKQYADVHFDVCYCSPLLRARETAEIFLRGRGVPVIPDERLIEMSFGVCEGTKNSFPATDGPMRLFFADPPAYIPPEGAESFSELFARTDDFLKSVALPLAKEGRDVLIVGHGALNSAIYCRFYNLPLEKFWSANIENCKLLKLK